VFLKRKKNTLFGSWTQLDRFNSTKKEKKTTVDGLNLKRKVIRKTCGKNIFFQKKTNNAFQFITH
jgi:hypothetical protein